jgi:hypothetical protein
LLLERGKGLGGRRPPLPRPPVGDRRGFIFYSLSCPPFLPCSNQKPEVFDGKRRSASFFGKRGRRPPLPPFLRRAHYNKPKVYDDWNWVKRGMGFLKRSRAKKRLNVLFNILRLIFYFPNNGIIPFFLE